MNINYYPDGTSYVNGIGMGLHGGVFNINSYTDLWHLHQAVDAYTNKFGSKPTVIIPNLIDAQADRRFNKGESSGLKLVCEFLNRIEADFKIFHPHNPEVVEALIDGVKILDNSTFIKEVLSEIHCANTNIIRDKGLFYHQKVKNLTLMSSDAGGFKPLMKLCDTLKWEHDVFSASKGRAFKDGKTHLTQLIDKDDFEGKDILIVDDISVFGGTFKGLATMLRKRNCGKIHLAVSHMTMQNLGNEPVTDFFDTVFTTDSKFNKYYVGEGAVESGTSRIPENLHIINMFNHGR